MIKFLPLILLSYAVYCSALFLLQRKLIFPTYYIDVPEKPVKSIEGLEVIWLETASGKVEAWYLPPENTPSGKTASHIIFAHGNAEVIDFCVEDLHFLTRLGVGVLLVEYPGYGRSQGSPSQKSITKAFVAGYDKLVDVKHADPSRIIFMGRSVGGGAACALAAERQPAAMILMSTFTSAKSFAYRYLAPSILVLDPFDNLKMVSSYEKPILIIHGRNDEIISYDHGTTLFEAAPSGRLITYESGHNDCPPDWTVFRRDITGFLKENGFIYPEIKHANQP